MDVKTYELMFAALVSCHCSLLDPGFYDALLMWDLAMRELPITVTPALKALERREALEGYKGLCMA